MKSLLKKWIGRRNIDRIKVMSGACIKRSINLANSCIGVSKINLGAGAGAEGVSWWTGDVQTGFVFDEATKLPMRDGSINFAYSSMFFEHINDETATNLLSEVKRVLKPDSCFRLIVPDFGLYIRKYRENDRDFFYNPANHNFQTWEAMGVPLDMEHLLANMISSIHNLPHEIVEYPSLEDFSANPPRVYHPFQNRYPGYYCGPAPELTTDAIKEKINSLTEADFLEWLFGVTNASKFQDPTFNSWHKNHWDFKKLNDFAKREGFSKVVESRFGEPPFALGLKHEKPQHAPIGLYFNIYN